MTRSTFCLLFYVNGSKEKNGIVPIMGRVTINGTVAQSVASGASQKNFGMQRATVPKARVWRQGKRTLRLCADDLLTRERLIAYHDSYAAAMAKYGLQRGVRGSEARHTTTAQYYRDLKRQTGELETNVQQLQNEQQQAERQLDEVRKDIKSEKLEAAKTEAKYQRKNSKFVFWSASNRLLSSVS